MQQTQEKQQEISLEMENNVNNHETKTQDHLQIILPNDIDGVDGRIPRAGPRAGVDDGLIPQSQNPQDNNNSHIFPTYNDSQTGFVEINGVMTPIPDVNAYQHKKTLAQGMMDLALLSANANQLRYVLETYRRHPYYYPSLIFISLSIIFQVAVGVGLILNGRYNIRNKKEICRANKINNYTVIGIFVITVVNVFISAFGVADPITDAVVVNTNTA